MRRFATYMMLACLAPMMTNSCSGDDDIPANRENSADGTELQLDYVGIASVSGGENTRTLINYDGKWTATQNDVVTVVALGQTYKDVNWNNWSKFRCEISDGDTAWNWNEGLSGDYRIRINNYSATICGYYPDIGSKAVFNYVGTTNAPCIYTRHDTRFTDHGSDAAQSPRETDYMFATPVEGVTNKNRKVSLTFNHSQAMLRFIIARDTSYRGTGYITNVVFGDTTNSVRSFKSGDWYLNIQTGAYQAAPSGSSTVSCLEWSDYETYSAYYGTTYHHIFNYSASTDPVEDGRVVLRTMITPLASVPHNKFTMRMMIDTKPIVLTECIPERTDGYKAGYCYTYYVRFTSKALILSDKVKVEKWKAGDTGIGTGELIAR